MRGKIITNYPVMLRQPLCSASSFLTCVFLELFTSRQAELLLPGAGSFITMWEDLRRPML